MQVNELINYFNQLIDSKYYSTHVLWIENSLNENKQNIKYTFKSTIIFNILLNQYIVRIFKFCKICLSMNDMTSAPIYRMEGFIP